jgi:hypothetical protein
MIAVSIGAFLMIATTAVAIAWLLSFVESSFLLHDHNSSDTSKGAPE